MYLEQNVYKSKNKYECVFGEENEDFNITLEKNDNILNEKAYVDYQTDPFNIALSGNLGSGRAFFYKDKNIKGLKTKLATSQNEKYSNGKYSLTAAIHSAIISNVLNDEINCCYKTQSIYNTKELYNFKIDILNEDLTVTEVSTNDFCAIEIRSYTDNQLYRLSNYLNDKKDNIDLKLFKKNCCKFEAWKIMNRFIHGSWSVGNISINGDLIDFDTSYFLEEYSPVYTNSNKYKETFFRFEYLAINKIVEKIFNEKYDIEKDPMFKEYKLIYFSELLCVDLKSNRKILEKLLELFEKLSLYTYTDEFYMDPKNNVNLNLIDFSYLIKNFLLTENCLKINFFKNNSENINKLLPMCKIGDYKNDLELFLELLNNLYSSIEINDKMISDIFYKNYTRTNLLPKYNFEKIININNKEKINNIINLIIEANKRNNKIKIVDVNILEDYIYFYKINDNLTFNIIVVPLKNIKYMKININNIEYMMSHKYDSNLKWILISEDIDLIYHESIFGNKIKFLKK